VLGRDMAAELFHKHSSDMIFPPNVVIKLGLPSAQWLRVVVSPVLIFLSKRLPVIT
jgi:hypothetical protein